MSTDNVTSTDAATPPQPSTKGRPGRVQTVSNNTSAMTEGDLARARAAKPMANQPTATGEPRSLRNRVSAADRVRLDAMHARAKKLANLKKLTGIRYVEAMREMTGIVDQIIQISAAYEERAHV